MPEREKSGWMSSSQAMQFAFELSRIRIGIERDARKIDRPFDTINARVRPLLDHDVKNPQALLDRLDVIEARARLRVAARGV